MDGISRKQNLKKNIRDIKKAFKMIWQNEDGDEAVQMAVLMPILMIVIAFIFDRFIIWEGQMYTAYAGNEALRSAVIQEDFNKAKQTALDVLKDRFKSTGMGWCVGRPVNNCHDWGKGASVSGSLENFNSSKTVRVAMATDKGWCNGSYLTLYVRTHKASLMPSYTTLRRLLTEGGPIYHEHVYKIRARVESNTVCKK